MTQEIRERIDLYMRSDLVPQIVYRAWWETTKWQREQIIDYILALVKEAGWKSPEQLKGWVELAEDQSLPSTILHKGDGWTAEEGVKIAQQDMLKADWRKVKQRGGDNAR